mgnify:CR=1 FL=1
MQLFFGWLAWLLTVLGGYLAVLGAVLCLSCGLYYAAELAEDADVAQVVEEFGFPSSADAEFVVQRARSLRKRGFEGALRRAQYDASRSGGDASHRVFGWPEPCCALTETREREKLVGYTCANQTTPACDGGYAACQGARDAAFFEESAKIE